MCIVLAAQLSLLTSFVATNIRPPAVSAGRGPGGRQDVAVPEHLQRLGAGVRRQSARDAGAELAPRGARVHPLPAAARRGQHQRHAGRG